MINFLDEKNIPKLIEIENFSLLSTLDIQKSLNKQLLLFMKNFTANIQFSSDLSPDNQAFDYLRKVTKALNKSNSNIKLVKGLIDSLTKIDISDSNLEKVLNKYNEKFEKILKQYIKIPK